MAHLLGAETLHLEYPTQVVFGSVTVGINDGDRIGIVGRNGDGKSSLLGLLTGRILPDSGRVTRRGGVRVGVLDQADTLDGTRTVGRELCRRQGRARVGRRPAGSATSSTAWCPTSPGMRRSSTLSGGQRRRVQLAALLMDDWDVIALDEPTNHLDIEGITWLAAHLKATLGGATQAACSW